MHIIPKIHVELINGSKYDNVQTSLVVYNLWFMFAALHLFCNMISNRAILMIYKRAKYVLQAITHLLFTVKVTYGWELAVCICVGFVLISPKTKMVKADT